MTGNESARIDGAQASARHRMSPTVTLPRAEYDLLVYDAGTWRLLNESPHVAEILAEWIEWAHRAEQREASHAISGMADWSAVVPSYAELQRRRSAYTTQALTPEQIRRRAIESWSALDHTTQGAA